VIPNELREKYRLRAGDKVALVDYGGVLSIVPAMTDPVAEAAGSFKGEHPGEHPLTRALLAERAEERAREG
jgi:bifunctional DNA-binding transcriptional regulator/antitoxin component of YhaV-PrlF toxin-antitoxin module